MYCKGQACEKKLPLFFVSRHQNCLLRRQAVVTDNETLPAIQMLQFLVSKVSAAYDRAFLGPCTASYGTGYKSDRY